MGRHIQQHQRANGQKRMHLSFSRTCLLSDNQLVNFVARHAMWYGRMRSPFGMNAFHCCQWYGVAVEDLWVVSPTYITKAVEARYDIRQISAVRAILELVFIRSGCFEFSDTKLMLLFSFSVPVNFYFFCFFIFNCVCTLCTISIININSFRVRSCLSVHTLTYSQFLTDFHETCQEGKNPKSKDEFVGIDVGSPMPLLCPKNYPKMGVSRHFQPNQQTCIFAIAS